ncbi:hypothetical protein V6N13_129466 [Hibiscus sabdariffa]
MRFYWLILYQLLCLQFILSAPSFRATLSSSSSSIPHLCSHTQSSALIHFKTHFSINETASKDCEYPHKSYPKTNSWKKGLDCCLWDGVTCDNITGQVIGLDLSCSWLSGTFTSNSTLFHLSHLQKLDLSFNDFRNSRISPSFGRFPSLTHLDLSSSWFSGSVPCEISYLSKLVSLHLSYRPSLDIISDIEAPGPTLKLETSTLKGIVRNLTKVRKVSLDGIDMSSVDPNSFINLSASLTSLSLVGCHLRGSFPDHIFNLPNIQFLTLDENPNLTGQFPKSNWTSPLEVLDASMTPLSGELPESLGNLKSLQGLGLFGCNLSGPIPASLGNLSQLRFLFLSWNHFSGEIPSSITNLNELGILNLASNQLEGSVPDNPNAFPNLGSLDLSDNLLSGRTPSWFYTIPSLTTLDLENNQFTGHIDEFQNRCLEILSLNNNSFHGPIPSSISELVNLTILDLSSNELNGTISLDMFSELQSLQVLYLSSNTLSLCSNNTVSYVLPNLKFVDLSSNIFHEFPKFLLGSKKLESLDLHSNFIEGDLPGPIRSTKSPRPLLKLRILDLSHNNFFGALPTSYIRSFKGMVNIVDNGKAARYMGERNYSYDYSVGIAVKGLEVELHVVPPFTLAEAGLILQRFQQFQNFFQLWSLSQLNTLRSFQFMVFSSISYLVPGRTLKLESSTLKGIVRNLTKPRWLPFEGSFPDNIFNLPNIQSLTLTANPNLSGQFPKSNWTSPLEVLDASMTPLSGELPGSLGNLKSLWGLALIGCNLSGSIPASLGNLSQLGFLFLSGNHFSGEIPSSVFSYKPHRTDNSCPCF